MTLRVRQLDCPHCGAKVDVRTGLRMRTFVCEYCGSVCQGQEVVALQEAAAARERNRPWSHLRLGMQANFFGRDYQIVGRIRVRDLGEDWWWDEWFLMSETGFPLFLQEEGGKFTVFRIFYPTEPPILHGRAMPIGQGRKAVVTERGRAEIAYVEGELTWQAAPGQAFAYMEARSGTDRFSIETEEDEVQFMRGQEVAPQQVYQWFGIAEPVPAPLPAWEEDEDDEDWEEAEGEGGREESEEEEKEPDWAQKTLRYVGGIGAALFVLLAIFAEGWLGISPSTKVWSRRLPAGAFFVSDGDGTGQQPAATGTSPGRQGLITDAHGRPVVVDLSRSLGAYELRLEGMPKLGNGECWWAEVDFLEKTASTGNPAKDFRVAAAVGGSFWHEKGQEWDSEDDVYYPYDEAAYKAVQRFRMASGKYHLRLKTGYCKKSLLVGSLADKKVTISLYKNVLVAKWFWIAAVILFILFLESMNVPVFLGVGGIFLWLVGWLLEFNDD